MTLVVDDSELSDRLIDAAAALAAKDRVRALAILDQLAAQWPKADAVRALRTEALLAAGDAEGALEEVGRLIELRGEDAEALALLAQAAWKTDKIRLAQRSYEKAVFLAPSDARLRADYAWFMAQARGPRPAENAAREAIALDATLATAWAALGVAQHKLHRPGEAEASLRKALELAPGDADAQAALLQVFQQQRQEGKALALASFMAEQGSAPEAVAAVQEEARQRDVTRRLVDRNVPLAPPAERRSGQWLALLAIVLFVAVFIGGLLLEPVWATLVVGIDLSLLVIWFLRRMSE